MAFLNSLNISASGMSASRLRLDVIGQNLSNAKSTRTEDGTPYVRQVVIYTENKSFDSVLRKKLVAGQRRGYVNSSGVSAEQEVKTYKGVLVTEIVEDETPLKPMYDPTHPDADENGYYYLPNVDVAEEEMDVLQATRAYEANLTVFEAVKTMAQKALSIGN